MLCLTGVSIPDLSREELQKSASGIRTGVADQARQRQAASSSRKNGVSRTIVSNHSAIWNVIHNILYRSVEQLEQSIMDYVANHNENPPPFVWTADADRILGKVAGLCKRINDSEH